MRLPKVAMSDIAPQLIYIPIGRQVLWSGDTGASSLVRQSHSTLAHWSTVRVSSRLCLEKHLNCEEGEECGHHDDTWHGGVLFGQKRWQAWIS